MFLIRLATNWLCIATSPVWVLPTLLWIIVKEVKKKGHKGQDERDIFITGKQWFWN